MILYTPVSVDHQFRAERIFQIYWLAINLVLIPICGLVHDTDYIFPREHRYNLVFISTSIIGACAGALSFVLFSLSRTTEEKESALNQEARALIPQTRLFERALEDRGQGNVLQSEFRKDFTGLFILLDFPLSVWSAMKTVYYGDPIWGVVTLLTDFLPGLEWHSRKDLVSLTKSYYWRQ